MRREKLTINEIENALNSLNGWNFQNDAIVRRFEFPNFAASLAFVNAVGKLAENADHHPDISFGWGYAEITFTTHDRGGVTDVDIAAARSVNKIL